MKNHVLGILNLAILAFGLVICCVNLNARVANLEDKSNELQLKVEEQDRTIKEIKERNRMQDVLINKMNAYYNSKVSEELQEVADRNGVGG